MKKNKKVIAVVVTYNRLELLKQCIEALRKQSHPLEGILVVNNGSTDGTSEWLAEQKDIYAVHQENLGGAGGFYTGFAEALKQNVDWVWAMDDDCIAHPEALQALVQQADDPNNIYCSVAVDAQKPEQLCWITKDIDGRKIKDVKQLGEQPIEVSGVPFLAIFLSTVLIKRIGFPIKEFFIWGDDTEYCWRSRKKANSRVFYIPQSRVYHPPTEYVPIHLLPFIPPILLVKAAPWKLYYSFRNNTFTNRLYSPPFKYYFFYLPKTIAKLWLSRKHIFKDASKQHLKKMFKAIYAGHRGKLGKVDYERL
ncbi:MAG: rhamnosyltransferase [Thermonema sp.]|uniref:glycosyltransferase family 2 protein n=1 Tax=Thermonema sp. TaxID=2231181 RepID=UPI0021DE3029|nr:glycosyltransferase family 2 protein [Thermonema sp.]GIV40180.1 MAG: rhamnosyltransferase [Thermonema sp.]